MHYNEVYLLKPQQKVESTLMVNHFLLIQHTIYYNDQRLIISKRLAKFEYSIYKSKALKRPVYCTY